MSIVPETKSAGGFVLNPSNELLMVQEFGEYWGLPRGHLHENESELDAAIREIGEESSIDELELCLELGSYTRPTFGRDGKPNFHEIKHITFFCFRTSQTDIRPIDPDITDAGWFAFSEARAKLINDTDIAFFDACIKAIVKKLALDA